MMIEIIVFVIVWIVGLRLYGHTFHHHRSWR